MRFTGHVRARSRPRQQQCAPVHGAGANASPGRQAVAISTAYAAQARSRARYWIVFVIFAVTVSIMPTAPSFPSPGRPSPRDMPSIRWPWATSSAFSWSYVAAQIPAAGCWIATAPNGLCGGIFFWSLFTFMQGWVGFLRRRRAHHCALCLPLHGGHCGGSVLPRQRPDRRRLVPPQPSAARPPPSSIRRSISPPVLFARSRRGTQEFGWRYAFISWA